MGSGNPNLLPVDDVSISLPYRVRFELSRVGAGGWFRDPECLVANFSRRDPWQVARAHGSAVLDFLEGKFRLLDRVNRRWDPRSLPSLAKRTQVRRSESIFGLVAGTIYIIWLLAVPYYPFLIFGPAASVLRLTPVWRQFYIPVIVLALGGLAQSAVNLVRPDWTWLRAATRLVSNVVVLIILIYRMKKKAPR